MTELIAERHITNVIPALCICWNVLWICFTSTCELQYGDKAVLSNNKTDFLYISLLSMRQSSQRWNWFQIYRFLFASKEKLKREYLSLWSFIFHLNCVDWHVLHYLAKLVVNVCNISSDHSMDLFFNPFVLQRLHLIS